MGKSRLQKYRLNRVKSREEFLNNYDTSLETFKRRASEMTSDELRQLNFGEPAAFCTHEEMKDNRYCGAEGSTSLAERSVIKPPSTVSSSSTVRSSTVSVDEMKGAVHLPYMTPTEREGPLGVAFSNLIGMFNALNDQLELQ